MLTSKFVPCLGLLHRATCALQTRGDILSRCTQPIFSQRQSLSSYSTAADNNAPPPRWAQLEPELDEALVPRKLSVSPLESWLSLRYSLPPLLECAQPLEDAELLEEKVLPPMSVPVLEDESGGSAATPLICKNVLKIRRRMMNRHKYKKLQKRIRFMKKRVLHSRAKRKQRAFEDDLQRIWRGAGLKKPPPGWKTPKIFLRQIRNRRLKSNS